MLNFITQFYGAGVAMGLPEVAAGVLRTTDFTPDVADALVPFEEASGLQTTDRLAFADAVHGTSGDELKRLAEILRTSDRHPGIFRRSKEEMLAHVRQALALPPSPDALQILIDECTKNHTNPLDVLQKWPNYEELLDIFMEGMEARVRDAIRKGNRQEMQEIGDLLVGIATHDALAWQAVENWGKKLFREADENLSGFGDCIIESLREHSRQKRS